MRHPVVELRQYTLHPGRRDELIELFDREFVESQEATGTAVLGQFRDLDDPDRFVWLRGFPGMAERAASLGAFYGGPVWREHRTRANATMIDSDDVLLLEPIESTVDADPRPSATVLVSIHNGGAAFYDRIRPILAETGGAPIVAWQTLHTANTFPALPIREDADVVVWLTRFTRPDGLTEHLKQLADHEESQGLTHLRLSPTAGSRLR